MLTPPPASDHPVVAILLPLSGRDAALGQQLQFDPEQAEALTNRMNTWLELKRRHGGELDRVQNLERDPDGVQHERLPRRHPRTPARG